MKTQKYSLIVMWMAVTLATAAPALAGQFAASLYGGYKGGAGFRVGVMALDFARGLPIGIEGAISYTALDPGSPEDARRIFINDATNGTPEESGWMWDYRLDFLYRLKILGMNDAFLFVGARYSVFTADFHFVGGNEDFEVSSNQFGVGLGARTSFPISQKVSISFLLGFDYFFNATLTGHDTSYSPGGETVNGKHNYTYKDADAAVNQPKLQPIAMLGFVYYF
jgi:hypothetical protein